jgi:hypothetical protein
MGLNRFYIISALLFILSVAVYGQINVKDSLQTILLNDTITPTARFSSAYNLILANSSPEEAEILGMTIVYPFVKREWKDDESQQLVCLANLQMLVSHCYRLLGEEYYEQERLFAEKGLDAARQSGNNAVAAHSCTVRAFREIKLGDIRLCHEYLYEAIGYYDKMEAYVKSSEMLYVIASTFFDTKDAEGMLWLLRQMEEYLGKDSSKQSLYQYNVIKHSYFWLLLEEQKKQVANETVDYQWVDSAMIYIRRNVELADNHLHELNPNWMHGYAYYYVARELNAYYPDQTDTIFSYLEKALDMIEREPISRTNEPNAMKELKAYISQAYAKAFFRKGKIQESYEAMQEALVLLDELKDYKNLSVSRHEAYEFMVAFYERVNRPGEALKYQKLLQENETRRYENEKIQVTKDLSVKYETEKKEMRIQALTKEKEIAHRIFWLTIGLLLALLATFLFIILLNRLKRKNVEQQLYETALMAELHQNELEKVQNMQQQLEQNPVENAIGRIVEMISTSFIDKDNKKAYNERLQKIDTRFLEHTYQTSKVKITNMDMKYIICFLADIDVKDISLLFNIDPASVRTVRYRIKKKFSQENVIRVIL